MVFYGIELILFNPPPLSIFGLLSARCDQNSGPRKIFSFMENNILSDQSWLDLALSLAESGTIIGTPTNNITDKYLLVIAISIY